MKRFFNIVLVIILALVFLASCVRSSQDNSNDILNNSVASINNDNRKIKIICTIFPIYDWVREIIGDNEDKFELSYLLDSGVDLHNFNPSAADIIDIQNCDLFIYVGGESDNWVNDVFNKVVKKDIVRLSLLELMGDRAKIEEVKEGMESEHEESELEEGEHEEELDEHVWLSIKNAKYICSIIKDNIIKLDSADSAVYESNCNNYSKALDELDVRFKDVANNAQVKVLLFGDRFPFRYLVDDYGIDYYAAFSGCSAETEASFETIIFLANKIDEYKLKHVMRIEGSNDKITKTIIENTRMKDQDIITMDSMQSTTASDVKNGVTYINIMQKNLNFFEEALE